MPEPLALLPLALAARGRLLDYVETPKWVAAGYTLLTRSVRLVRTLSGGRSAILLPPGGAFLTALAASDGRGAVLINPLASRAEILYQLNDAGVTAVFTNEELGAGLPEGFPRVHMEDAPRSAIVIIDGVVQPVDLGDHFGLELSGSTDVEGRDEEAVIVYTSAMHGKPLGAILTHRNLLFNAYASAKAFANSPDDRCLVALPFAHLFGLVVATCAPLLAGASVTNMEKFHPAWAFQMMMNQRITQFLGVPSMFYAMLDYLDRKWNGTFEGHDLRLCFSGGAVVPEELQNRWFAATGVELRQGYGLTEAGPAALLTRVDSTNVRGTLGVPIDETHVSVRDTATSEALPQGVEGELCVRGPHVFRGYVSSGELGLQVRNGWLHTGDRGVANADGTYSFRGLIKPMFTRNGFNIYPHEIENALLRHPNVESAEVYPIPELNKENLVAARVAGTVTHEEIKRWAQQELAAYKVPSSYEIVAE